MSDSDSSGLESAFQSESEEYDSDESDTPMRVTPPLSTPTSVLNSMANGSISTNPIIPKKLYQSTPKS